MADPGFVGLDPDLCRALARRATTAADDAGRVGDVVAQILSAGQMRDTGSVALIREVDEELGLVANALKTKANHIESASRQGALASDNASAALWASLQDKTGAGFDAKDDWSKEGGEVPLSPTMASSVLAEYLRAQGGDATLDHMQLRALVNAPGVPVEVRAAAKFMAENGEVWSGVVGFGRNQASAVTFDEFVTANRNLAIVAAMSDRLDVAKQDAAQKGSGSVDGKITFADIDAALQNKSGRFTQAELDALKWVLAHQNEMGLDVNRPGFCITS